MKTISLADLQQQVNTRKGVLGVFDTPSEIEAMRNKGGLRTPEKRELLRRAAERSRATGRQPFVGYF